MNNTIKSSAMLTLTALIWGMGFVAQRSGMDFVGPFFFNGVRMFLGCLPLLIYLLVRNRAGKRRKQKTAGNAEIMNKAVIDRAEMKTLLIGGAACGLALYFASSLQQVGLVFTTASKTGFLTALYIVLVPLFAIFLKHKIHWNSWVSVAIAAIGLYFLCINEALTIAPGDLLVLIGAAFWAIHILVIDHFAPRVDVIKLSIIQFCVVGVLCLLTGIFADSYFAPPLTVENLIDVIPTILYAGVFSSGLGFTFQAVGQKYANPTAASIILSLESVFAVLGGFALLGESFTGREAFGCVLMFGAVILAQLPFKGKNELNA